jgi:small subunit ribosomal protein S16
MFAHPEPPGGVHDTETPGISGIGGQSPTKEFEMVSIRLARHGSKRAPFYRIVATDVRARRDGRFIEILGHYNPVSTNKELVVKADRVQYWLDNGAQPTDSAARLLKQARHAAAAAEQG